MGGGEGREEGNEDVWKEVKGRRLDCCRAEHDAHIHIHEGMKKWTIGLLPSISPFLSAKQSRLTHTRACTPPSLPPSLPPSPYVPRPCYDRRKILEGSLVAIAACLQIESLVSF